MPHILIVCGLALLLASGCTNTERTPDVDQFAEGEQLYSTYCASCHEIEGGIGPILTSKVLSTRVTARYLYNYNKANMPYEAGNTLQPDQYWSITAYLLIREGFMDSSVQLSEATADTMGLGVRRQ